MVDKMKGRTNVSFLVQSNEGSIVSHVFSHLICTLGSDFEGGKKVVLKIRIFFLVADKEKRWAYKPTFSSGCRTTFLPSAKSLQRVQIKRLIDWLNNWFEFRDRLEFSNNFSFIASFTDIQEFYIIHEQCFLWNSIVLLH